jgi:hypothetical protein
MDRQLSRFFRRATVALLVSSASTLTLAAQAPAGIRYEFTTVGDKGDAGTGVGYVLGDTSRMEMPGSGGEYLVMKPGHLYSVHPDKREYSDSPPEALTDIIGKALRATQLIVRFELSDASVVTQDLGDGEAVAGQPTRHFQLVQRFAVSVHPLIIGSTDDPPEVNEVVTDYWVAKNLKLPRNPLVELLARAPSALAQQDRAFARKSSDARDSLFEGMPLKLHVTTRKKGEHPKVAEHFEVTSLTRATVSHSQFEIPPGYRRTDDFSLHSM